MTSEDYDAWHAALEVDEGASTPWHVLARELLEPARDLQGKRVLEIGCGRGGFAAWLSRQGALVTAADFSPGAIKAARAHFTDSGVTWSVQDIQHIELPGASFDTVVSCETVEHVPEPRRAIAELARVLRPGGTLVLTCPNYFGLMGLYRGYLRVTGRRFTEAGQPINQFTVLPRTLLWLGRAGLRIERVEGSGHYLPFPGRPPLRTLSMDRVRFLRWWALHSAIRARLPLAS
jgi:2-polyprenyl-3-methyl-5-hydroxy-6-metoxy-1,4-benzoquinol methylase